MFRLNFRWLRLGRTRLVSFVIIFSIYACGCNSKKRVSDATGNAETVAGLLNSRLPSYEVDSGVFHESCFIIEELLREKIPEESDISNALGIAKDLRVLVGTVRKDDDKNKIALKGDGTIKELFADFADKWSVAVLVDHNVIFIVEDFDVERYPHQVAILPPK